MNFKRGFTLIEVVVALAILTGGLAVLLSMATQAQNRIGRAREQWTDFHMLEQAAEYYLLQPGLDPDAPPAEIFDYPGYSAHAEYTDAENVPEEFEISGGVQATLRCWTISVMRDSDRKTVESIKVDRIDYDNLR